MKPKGTLLVSLLATVLLGCGKQPLQRDFVLLPDVSASIEPKAEEEVFKAIDDLVSHLNRGDRITIIPILGDAQAEASGRILRFEVPTNRQAYDSDLRHFAAKLRDSLEELKSSAMKHPGTKTDILGSISLAEQEFQSDSGFRKGLLVVLSDFIQEDNEINFMRDRRLDSQPAAKEFAWQIARRDGLDLKGMPVYLGLLRSREYAGLSRSRRAAIQAFWISYLKSLGGKPRFVTDGPGLLK
jgi:hypothetical protein